MNNFLKKDDEERITFTQMKNKFSEDDCLNFIVSRVFNKKRSSKITSIANIIKIKDLHGVNFEINLGEDIGDHKRTEIFEIVKKQYETAKKESENMNSKVKKTIDVLATIKQIDDIVKAGQVQVATIDENNKQNKETVKPKDTIKP